MKLKKAFFVAATAALFIATNGAQAKEIKVGFMTTLSGPNAVLGAEVRDGFNLGIKHSGGDNTLGGYPFELLTADDQQNPETGRQTVDRFIKREKIDVMTGIVASNVLLPILPALLASDTIYLSPNTGPADYAGNKCHKNFFAVAWQNEDIPEAMGVYATSEGLKRVALIAPNYPGGRESIAGFKRGYEGDIVEEIYTSISQMDFAAELSTIRAARPDAVFFFLPGGMGVQFIKQFAAAGLDQRVKLLAPGFSADADTINAVGEQMVGLRNAAQWVADLDNDANKRFVADFVETYGRLPTMYASQGYDVARLLDSAIRAVDGQVNDREAFRAALRNAQFESVRGSFKFNTNNYPIQDIHIREVVKNGNGEIVNKYVSTILEDHSDSFASQCDMK